MLIDKLLNMNYAKALKLLKDIYRLCYLLACWMNIDVRERDELLLSFTLTAAARLVVMLIKRVGERDQMLSSLQQQLLSEH